MKYDRLRLVLTVILFITALLGVVKNVSASDLGEIKIVEGVSIGNVDISNMSKAEAKTAVQKYVKDFSTKDITIDVVGQKVVTNAYDLGYRWTNTEVLNEASDLCTTGNVIKRYKDKVDIANSKKNYELQMGFTTKTLNKNIYKILESYNIPAANASLSFDGSSFKVTKEKSGLSVDMTETANTLISHITNDWDGEGFEIEASTSVAKAQYTYDMLKKISTTPMGSFTTQFNTYAENANRNLNIKNGANLINHILLYPGETYSCESHLSPWTEDNGWHTAGTFENGKESTGLGGGICQVSTTLYNALLLAEVNIVTRFNHSMTVDYVPLSQDAAIAEGSKDLIFSNTFEYPIYIESYYEEGALTYSVYGYDQRPDNRTIKYESETLTTTDSTENITVDYTKDESYREVTSYGYTGYTAKLWKVVYEDGKQVSRDEVNSSTYIMTPTEVTVGVTQATEGSEYSSEAAAETTVESGSTEGN